MRNPINCLNLVNNRFDPEASAGRGWRVRIGACWRRGNAPRGADEASFTRGCCVEGEEEEEEGDEEWASFFKSAHRSAVQVIGSGGGAR